eukprot:m.138948 g.138948  ORF g.138948 m.138948 type:complete len:549 (-) comp17043_c1_seq3:1249-2895(-)
MGQSMAKAATLTPEEERKALNHNCSVAEIVERVRDGRIKSIVVMAGAGISVSCGIPDFRTPGTGLYDNLQRFDLPNPQAIFSIDYFRESPEAFFMLAKEMYPSNFAPSPTHAFFRLLHDKGLLRRLFTQNIDTLSRAAGIPAEALVEAHGSFASAHCIDCHVEHAESWVKDEIFADRIPVRCPSCSGLVKPDIVFFGEALPDRFDQCRARDLPQADLLIVAGTSLAVHPFAGIMHDVSDTCPRLLLNMEPAGVRGEGDSGHGFRFDQADNWRDVLLQGPCDDAVRALCDALGWRDELEQLVTTLKSKGGSVAGPVNVDAVFGPGAWGKNHRAELDMPASLQALGSGPNARGVALALEGHQAAAAATTDAVATTDAAATDATATADAAATPAAGATVIRDGDALRLTVALSGDAKENAQPGDRVVLAPSGALTIPEFDLDWPLATVGGRCDATLYLSVPRLDGRADEMAYEVWFVRSEPTTEILARFGPVIVRDGGSGSNGSKPEGNGDSADEDKGDEALNAMDQLQQLMQATGISSSELSSLLAGQAQ